MNEIVERFIGEHQKKEEEERIKRRKEHLQSLGLVTQKKVKQYCTKDWSDKQREEYGFVNQDEKGFFKYKMKTVDIDISDEEYEEICKYCPPGTITLGKKTVATENYAETVAIITAYVFLTLGIIASIILLGIAISEAEWLWVGVAVCVLLFSLITWALSLVFVNISCKLDK